MTQRKPRTFRRGARVTDGHGTGTALNNTGLPEILDPRLWIWVDWNGDRGLKPARLADLTTTETAP